jgi:3-oxoacid CoA-transferase subunit A
VAPGALDPDQVHLPGIYVKRLVKGPSYQKWIERRTVRPRDAAGPGQAGGPRAGEGR